MVEEWHVEHAVGRKWRRLGVTFPLATPDADLRAYLAPLAEKHNAARVVNQEGTTIELRKARIIPNGDKRGAYSAKTTRGMT